MAPESTPTTSKISPYMATKYTAQYSGWTNHAALCKNGQILLDGQVY
jgi:hypothetical protein